ncbi:hypothetical protein ACC771_06730, partial [Rhizobium ruizarguesonis]
WLSLLMKFSTQTTHHLWFNYINISVSVNIDFCNGGLNKKQKNRPAETGRLNVLRHGKKVQPSSLGRSMRMTCGSPKR